MLVEKGVTIFKWQIFHLDINLFILKSTKQWRIIPYYPIRDCWAVIVRIWGNCLNLSMNDSCLTALQQLSSKEGLFEEKKSSTVNITNIWLYYSWAEEIQKCYFSLIHSTPVFSKLQYNLLNLRWTFQKFVTSSQLIESSENVSVIYTETH